MGIVCLGFWNFVVGGGAAIWVGGVVLRMCTFVTDVDTLFICVCHFSLQNALGPVVGSRGVKRGVILLNGNPSMGSTVVSLLAAGSMCTIIGFFTLDGCCRQLGPHCCVLSSNTFYYRLSFGAVVTSLVRRVGRAAG